MPVTAATLVTQTVAQGSNAVADLGVRTWADAGTAWDDSEVTWGGWTARGGGAVINQTEEVRP